MTDDEVRHAMVVAFETLQLVLEPSGAVALAALLSNKVPDLPDGGVVGVVASGGNCSLKKFMKIVGT